MDVGLVVDVLVDWLVGCEGDEFATQELRV